MKIAALMGFEAATLVIASILHLAGVADDGSPPFDPTRAGIAEAVIAVVLVAGAIGLVRGVRRGALGAVAFAIAGFGVGLSMTVRGGATGDIVYHATMLPLLLFTLVWLASASGAFRRGPASRRTA
jgi:hypothetical protein